jgi:hypothetical protein
MRNSAVSVGESSKGSGRKLCRPEARRHQCRRRRIQAGIEITADDRTRDIAAAVDPGQELLHLKQPQRVVAPRHEQVSDIDVHRHVSDQHARDQCDHVARLVIEIPGFDNGEARQQRLSFDLGEAVHFGLLYQGVVMAGSLDRSGAKIASRLRRQAYFVECDQVGRQSCYLVDDQRPTRRPAFMILFEVQCDYTERHSSPPPASPTSPGVYRCRRCGYAWRRPAR